MPLRPMTEQEYEAFREASPLNFARDAARAARTDEEALASWARSNMERLLPDGLSTRGHHILSIVDDEGAPVGYLWVGVRVLGPDRHLFVFDLAIHERHRGRGYGKAAMKHAEHIAAEENISEIQLNVFASNSIARALYADLGYEDAAITMVKRLVP